MFLKMGWIFVFSFMLTSCFSSSKSNSEESKELDCANIECAQDHTLPDSNAPDSNVSDVKEAIYNALEVKGYDVNYNESKWQ